MHGVRLLLLLERLIFMLPTEQDLIEREFVPAV
jgi:hypothetical protein